MKQIRFNPIHCKPPAILLLGGVMLLLVGCATPKPITQWRVQVEDYLDEADGDLGALRELNRRRSPRVLRSALVTVGVLDVPVEGWPPGQRRDVQGVLVDTVKRGDETWAVFMVAVVEPGDVLTPQPAASRMEDLRLVLLRKPGPGDNRWQWRVSRANDDMLARYRAWRLSGPPDDVRMDFPGVIDQFVVTRQGGPLTVEERGSGATWSINIDRRRLDTKGRRYSAMQ